MRRITRYLKSHFSHFQAKLLLAFLLCTLFPLAAISCISYFVSYRIAEDKIILSTLHSDDQINLQINDRLKQTENVADSIQYDMYSLTQACGGNIMNYLETLSDVRTNISLFNSTFDFLHTYIYLPEEHMGAGEQLFFRSLDDLNDILPADQRQLKTAGTASVWFYHPAAELPFILTDSKETRPGIGCFRLLKNQGTQITEYAYLILLDPQEFGELLTNTFDNTVISSYLVSDAGKIVAHNGGPSLSKPLSIEKWNLLKDNKNTLFRDSLNRYHVVQLDNGWYHITEIPESYIKSNINVLLNTILVTLAFSLPLTICVIIMISKNLTRRITALSSAMEQVQLQENGDLLHSISISYPKDPETFDEIDKLGITFEKMQLTLQENMKAILDFSITEEKLKYQLLQSQINPHFLYNILGSIQSCQSIGKLDIANQMITDLTRFYRLTLRNSNELIPIRQELEIAELYLEMEKLCHNDNLTWSFQTEDGVENFLICKFTLQPFLENSILHGLSGGTSRIHIDLKVCYKNDSVLIVIADNGIGMSPTQLANLRMTLEEQIVDYEKHFGIGNVNKRIKSPSFGNGTIQIDSTQFQGTTITIEFIQMEDDHEKSDDC